jgi:hypothetical protein
MSHTYVGNHEGHYEGRRDGIECICSTWGKPDLEAVWERASAAALNAHQAAVPDPMTVTDGRQTWHVADGLCGFAGVVVKGNSAFGRWTKKNGIGRKHYPRGRYISTNYMSQSVARAEAAARAMAEVLREAGVDCHVESNLD